MKISCLLAIAYSICVHVSASEIICSPEDPTDCYPQIFEATENWQIIREGQDIPAGLHVRLNMETQEKEAKLLDPSDQEGSNAIVVAESLEENEHDSDSDEGIDIDEEDRTEDGFYKVEAVEDINDLKSAIDEFDAYKHQEDVMRLRAALELLIDLSHDIEYGVQLAGNQKFMDNVRDGLPKMGLFEKEMLYRMLTGAFSNNPEAVDIFMNANNDRLIVSWIKEIRTSRHDVVVSRALGVFRSLVANNQFKYEYLEKYELIDLLLTRYSDRYTGEATKARIIHIFETLNVLEGDISEEVLDRTDHPDYWDPYKVFDRKVSDYLQKKLVSYKFDSEDQFKSYYQKLIDLHQQNSDLKPSKEFVAWLDEESGLRANGLKERDELFSDNDKEFDKRMLETRHNVFGNPNALRKHFNDEL